MDEMNIVSKFTNGLISKIIEAALRKQLGSEIRIDIHAIHAKVENGKTTLHIDADANVNNDEIPKLLNKFHVL